MQKNIASVALFYLRFFAQKALKKHQPTIIGIAGSVGKTSTRNAIEAILKDYFPVKSIGNSETGIPLGILGMKPESYSKIDWLKMLANSPLNTDFLKGTKYLIAEMGIDDPNPPKNMDYLLTILKPDIALSLNIAATHTMQFEKALTKEQKEKSEEKRMELIIEKIAEEDTKIITKSDCKVGIYNSDDTSITDQLEKKELSSTKLLSFGSKNTNDISYGKHEVSLKGTSFQLFMKTEDAFEEIKLHFKRHILPQEYREVFAAAILVGLQAGLTMNQIKTSLEKNYEAPKGRSSIFEGINQSVIIDSTYNASRISVEAFLELADTLKKETGKQIIFLFGDMRELGHEAKSEHEAVAQRLLGIVDYLYLVGPLTREHVLPLIQMNESLLKEIRWFDTSERAGEYLQDNLPKDTLLLAKGSQNTIYLEEAIKKVLADKNDAKYLCRQDEYWEKIKTS